MPTDDKTDKKLPPGLRNTLVVLGFFALTLGATALEMALKSHEGRPLVGNVVALALLNINVLLLAVLVLLIGRQLVKLYFERKASPFGAGYRSRLTLAFVALSIVPAGILFVVAIQLLTGGVKYWFGPKVEGTVRGSLALADTYVKDRQDSALRACGMLGDRLSGLPGGVTDGGAGQTVEPAMAGLGIDIVELYDARGNRVAGYGRPELTGTGTSPEFLRMVLDGGNAAGELDTPAGMLALGGSAISRPAGKPAGFIIVGSLIPPSVSANISGIREFYSEYWGLRTFKNPLKESYALSLVLFMLVVVFAAIWSGLYMSKDVTVPITSLAEAAERISRGEYDITLDVQAKDDELGALVNTFRRMARDLRVSSERLSDANVSLTGTNELLEQRRRFIETILDNVNTGVMTIDRSGKITTANRAAGGILGLDISSIVGRGYRDVFEFHQLSDIREKIIAMSATGDKAETEVQLSVNRRTLNLRLFLSALRDAEGGYLGILVVFEDLTSLIKAQRAAAWREAARRIAHEIKNPLTPIQLSAQRLRKRYMDGTGDYESIIDDCTRTIIAEVESMKGLVNEFSEFARMPEPKPVPSSLHGLADTAAALFAGAHNDVEIIREYDPAMPALNLDPEQIKRAMVNLVQNAVTALEGKGRIWLRTRYDASTQTAEVEVADDGPGILAEDRDRLFQPYFSRNKSGTGLGLAIVYRIITDHGGSIRAEGNRPKGARFIIELPASPAA